MRKLSFKILLSVLCVAALMVGTFGGLSVSANGKTKPVNKYDVDSWNGKVQTGKVGDGVVTAWDILKVDGYIEGVWFPWLTHSWLGSGLASNKDMEDNDGYTLANGTKKDYWQTMTEIGIEQYNNDQLKMEIFNLKALGFNMMAYAGSPWGEGRVNDTNTWRCTGVQETYLQNMRKFLDICREVNMPVVWYIHFHSSAVPGYASLDMWYRIDQVKATKEYADEYAENFVRPVCEVLAEYRDIVVMCGIADETYNEINDSNLGDGKDNGSNEDTHFDEGDREQYGVTQEDSMYFHAQIGQMVKKVMPDMPTTCADNADQYAMYGDAMLDMPGRNQYSSGTTPSASVADAWATGPLLAGEYGCGDSASSSEDTWATTITGKRTNYLNGGYSGFFLWGYQPTFDASKNPSGNQLTKKGATTPYDFRKGTYEGYYWSETKKNALGDSTKNPTGAPSAMYYYGKSMTFSITNSSGTKTTSTTNFNGKVYWLQPKNVTSYTVQRTTDGGSTWTTISGSVSIDSDTGSYRYCMTDPSPVSSGTVQYRITVNGKTSYTNEYTY